MVLHWRSSEILRLKVVYSLNYFILFHWNLQHAHPTQIQASKPSAQVPRKQSLLEILEKLGNAPKNGLPLTWPMNQSNG